MRQMKMKKKRRIMRSWTSKLLMTLMILPTHLTTHLAHLAQLTLLLTFKLTITPLTLTLTNLTQTIKLTPLTHRYHREKQNHLGPKSNNEQSCSWSKLVTHKKKRRPPYLLASLLRYIGGPA